MNGNTVVGGTKQYIVNEDGVPTEKAVAWSTNNVLVTIIDGLATVDPTVEAGTVVVITAVVDGTTLNANLNVN